MHELEGYLHGIIIDSIINASEKQGLENWLKKHIVFRNKHPYSEIIPTLELSLSDDLLTNDEAEDLFWLCNNFRTSNSTYDIITSDIQRLHGILHGIMSDAKISTVEVRNLSKWLDDNTHLSKCYPYDEINSIITSVLQDGVVSDDEEKLLKVVFAEFVDLEAISDGHVDEISKLRSEITVQGICAVDPKIVFSNNLFCFTGKSSKHSRGDIENIVIEKGGNYKQSVVDKLNYLVIGDNGNPCWAYSCYGRKVEDAIKLRKNGNPIQIIHENDFWDSLEK